MKYIYPTIFAIAGCCASSVSAGEITGSGKVSLDDIVVVQPASTIPDAVLPETPDKDGKKTRKFISVVDMAPGLLNYFNDAMPVFGTPSTITSDNILERTQILGDPGGVRSNLAANGLFFDLYTTSGYEHISGGLHKSSSFIQSAQLSATLDTGRANMWSGGLFHFTVQGRGGSKAAKAMNAGSSSIAYTALTYPLPEKNSVNITEYYLVQALSKNAALMLGKISTIFVPDQTLFGSSSKTDWANFSFSGVNPVLVEYYSSTSWVALGILSLNEHVSFLGGLADPYSTADNFANHMFKEVNIYGQSNISYNIGELPGLISPSFNWSSKTLVDFSNPVDKSETLDNIMSDRALRMNIASGNAAGVKQRLESDVAVNYKNSSYVLFSSLSQYLYLVDPANADTDIKSGKLVRGLGLQGRIAYGPSKTNFIDQHYNIGLYGAGLMDLRPADRYGVGIYYNHISKHLRNIYSDIKGKKLHNETGLEVFYDIAITPAINLTTSYEYIRHPTYAEAIRQKKSTNMILSRLNINW